MKDLNITVENGVKEVILRTGQAEIIYEPVVVSVTGNIDSPFVFLKNRGELIDSTKAHIIIDRTKMEIELRTDENYEKGDYVCGKIVTNPELAQFKINQENTYGLMELIKFLKRVKVFFPNKEAHAKLINNLTNFNAKSTSDVDKSFDGRGNVKNNFEKKVTSDVPLDFKLLLPIFKGTEKKSIFVAIGFDLSDGGTAKFWLESDDLYEMIVTERDRLIDEQIKNLTPFNVVMFEV